MKAVTRLSVELERVIRDLPTVSKTIPAGHDFVVENDKPDQCALICAGWACRHKMTAAGKRQILSLHFAGELPDLQSLLLSTMDHSLAAITDLEIAFIPHTALKAAIKSFPELALPLWRMTLVDGAIYREWLLAMGRLQAELHMGHLFCELQVRLEAVGMLKSDGGYDFPITQADLADALGMSSVHVNRSVQALRQQGLISWSNGHMVINDFDELTERSEFDPTYLHQTARLGAF